MNQEKVVPVENYQAFIDQLFLDFAQVDLAVLQEQFEANLSELGKKWWSDKKTNLNQEKQSWIYFFYHLNFYDREKLVTILTDSQKYPGIVLHDLRVAVDLVLDPYTEEIFGDSFKKFFK